MGMFDYFKTVLTIQLFWSFAFTILIATIPVASLNFVQPFANQDAQIDISSVSTDMESSIDSQLNIPLVDAGALLFYSGNIVIDLMLNFLTAVPSMFTLLLSGLFLIIPVDAFLQKWILLFTFALVGIMYMLGLMAFLSAFRSGRGFN